MIVNVNKNSFGIQHNSNGDDELLRTEQERASEDFLIQTLVGWWSRNVSEAPLTQTDDRWDLKRQIEEKLENIEKSGDQLLERSIDGWAYIFDNPSGSSRYSNISTSGDGRVMTGTSIAQPNESSNGSVQFRIEGINLGLNNNSYTIKKMYFDFSVPNSVVDINISLEGNIQVLDGEVNKQKLKINKIEINAGGFIKWDFDGEISFVNERQKYGNYEFVRINTRNFSFFIDNDPTKEGQLFLLSFGGDFYETISNGTNTALAIKPTDSLKSLSVGVGDAVLALNSLNIKSNQPDLLVESSLEKAVQVSLVNSGLNLGFKLDFGNDATFEFEDAQLKQSRSNPKEYYLTNAKVGLSFDTELGPEIVSVKGTLSFDSTINIDSGRVVSTTVTGIYLFSPKRTSLIDYPVLLDVSDIRIDSRSFDSINADTIELMLAGIEKYDESKSRNSEVTYDGSLDVSISSLAAIKDIKSSAASGEVINLTGNRLNNQITGGASNDTIYGGLGADRLFGGMGSDIFVYKSFAESKSVFADTIKDFNVLEDLIDLSGIDANVKINQNVSFKYTIKQYTNNILSSVPGSNSIWFNSSTHFLYGDVNGDSRADFQIKLVGLAGLPINCIKLVAS